MKKEYDFSKGVRRKFYRGNTKVNLPVYLDDDNREKEEDKTGCSEACTPTEGFNSCVL
jgi:hypothetical protein